MTRRFTRCLLAAIVVLAVSPLSAAAQPRAGVRAERAAEPGAAATWTADNGNGTFSNPLFYDEFSDCDLIRVGKDFYLTGTTMHSMPGLPILHSRDLVNWRFLAYALDTLDLGPAFRLEEGKQVYGQGIWAPSFRFHKGTFHIFSNVNGQTTQLFRATNPAGPWTRTAMKRSFHDLSVLFDDDGKAYVVWGYRGIRLAELTPDLLDIVPGTEREIIAPGAGMGEGLHLYKIRGKYFLTSAWFLDEMRMPTARADRLTGPWEVNQEVSRGEDFGFAEGNRLEQRPAGSPPPPPFAVRAGNADAPGRNAIHQGGIVDTPTGEWWGFSMMDANSVGRLTALSPVTWADGWPYFGLAKNLGRSPRIWVKPGTGTTTPPTVPYRRSDDFSATRLQPIWQWNHVPVAGKWSLSERPGHLRLHALAAGDLLAARNTLTQRAIGPRSTPTVVLDASGLKPGDAAGLALFNRPYAWLGVSVDAEGPALTYVTEEGGRVARVSLAAGRVWLRAACDFLREEARFSYSTDGRHFQPIGDPFRLVFQLMTFQGVRYSLFAFGSGGGFADFDAIDVREPDPRGLTIPIPYGRPIELAAQGQAQGPPPRRWQAAMGDAVQVGEGAGTRFTVLDRGLGRVALRSERGLVSVGADGTVSVRAGTPGEAETFQWIESFTGELTLLSLATQRYVRLDADAGVLRADARGPHPNRRDGVRWIWSGPADLPVPRTDANSRLAHEQLLAKRTQGRIDVYFVGDSITRRWGATDYPDFLAHWKTTFAGWNAGDFGWGADSTQHILWRLQHGELDGVDPKVIVILAGTNNVGSVPAAPGKTADKVADVTKGLQAIVDLCRRKAPRATIVLTGIFPRNDNMAVMPEIHAINANLAKLADGRSVRFLSVNDKLADAQGTLLEGMAGDQLHPTLKGYQVWADGLTPILTELLGPRASTDLAPPPTGDPSARPRPAPQPAATPAPAPAAAPAAAARPVATFPLSQIRLLDGPFKRSEALNLAYVQALEVDRLLAPFRTDAGLTPKAEPYPNWESTGLQGHTAGHYLTALAQAWASTGDADAKRRLDVMVSELAECQRAHGNGYVGAVPKSRELWAGVAAGTLKVERFGLNGAWVPWYNLHKLFAGLRDAHLIGGNAQARAVLVALADWCAALVSKLSDDQVQQMLGAEHGGMNEVLADVFALTGDRKYLDLAQRFSHRALLEPLTRRDDPLTGLHANTQIPKVVGYGRIAELGGDPAGRDAAAFFWDTVVNRRTVAFGGNSVREHFNAVDDFAPMLESREGPETCNTYNMLRLTELLFRGKPLAEYADYYERSLYNHILSTQHPEHGGYVYFTPIRPRHYRVYSQPKECFWCCVGTGMENHGKHGQFVYAHRSDELFVNLFVASELKWPERGLTVRQDTTFPDEPRTRLRLTLAQPRQFAVHVRHPAWVAEGAFRVTINGQPWPTRSTPSSYVAIDRSWRDGDRIEIELPMRTRLERLPDGSDYAAIMHGPILLAARTGTEQIDGLIAGPGRMAHTSPGPYLPLDAAPMLVGDIDALAARVEPVPGRPLTFRAPEAIRPASARGLELVPFFRVHDSRYMIYWRVATAAAYERVVSELRETERLRLRLEARTLDRVVPGEQQSEIDHGVRSDGSTTGVTHGRPFRDATGSFGYDLRRGTASGPLQLLVTYSANERDRRFEILVDDQTVATVTLDGRQPDRFTDVAYPIPPEVVAADADGVLAVRFVARTGSRAGAVYDVRLVRPE